MLNDIIKLQKEANERHVYNMWVVYDHPVDFPKQYVARRFEVRQSGGIPIATTDIVKDARVHVIRACFRCAGLIPFPRKPQDDLAILETWL